MHFDPSFKDSYVSLSGGTVLLDSNTVIESQNAVVLKTLSPLLVGEKPDAVKAIRFLPFGQSAREKVISAFGPVLLETEDAYLLEVNPTRITVYASNVRGYLYGACTLLSHYREGIGVGYIYNAPTVQLRAVKMYLPAEEKMDEFYYMLDMLMHFGYNALILEVGGAMEYKKHPEINAFWEEHCAIFNAYGSYATDLQNSQYWRKSAIHTENGGGSFLSQNTVRAICEYARSRGLEPIPEVTSLTNADYLLAGRADLAERPEDPYPDAYCPSNPASYQLLFEVMDEVIEVFAPKVVHIGHGADGVYGVCDKCRRKSAAELFAGDVMKIRDYLAARGIRTMMWSEKLTNSYDKNGTPAGGAYYVDHYLGDGDPVNFRGKEYYVQRKETLTYEDAALLPSTAIFTPVQETYPAIAMIPRDVIAMNRHWCFYARGDRDYHYHRIPMVYGLPQAQRALRSRAEAHLTSSRCKEASALRMRSMHLAWRGAVITMIRSAERSLPRQHPPSLITASVKCSARRISRSYIPRISRSRTAASDAEIFLTTICSASDIIISSIRTAAKRRSISFGARISVPRRRRESKEIIPLPRTEIPTILSTAAKRYSPATSWTRETEGITAS